jgi:hypothetical protein
MHPLIHLGPLALRSWALVVTCGVLLCWASLSDGEARVYDLPLILAANALVALALTELVHARKERWRLADGVIVCVALGTDGVGRFFAELLREETPVAGPLNPWQILVLGMVVICAVLGVRGARRTRERDRRSPASRDTSGLKPDPSAPPSAQQDVLSAPCKPLPGVGLPCTDGGACADGASCDVVGTDLVCVAQRPEGAACAGASCLPGLTCSHKGGKDTCTRVDPPGCYAPTVCGDGVCDTGEMLTCSKDCGGGGCFQDGDPCAADADCCSFLCGTDGLCGTGSCTADGDPCAGDGDCCSGLCDSSNTCSP